MKKICFVTTVSITLKTFVINTAEYLHQNTDWDITFVCDDDPEFRASLPSYIHFHPISMKRGVNIGGVKAMLEMMRFFKSEGFDLVQYSTPNASLYAAMAARFAQIPVRLYCQWGLAYVGFKGVKRQIFKLVEKLVCSLSTHIEPDSNSNLKFAHSERLYPQTKGNVIWNGSASGVNVEKFNAAFKVDFRNKMRMKYQIPQDAFVFIFVGRITRDKGVNELFQAFSRFNDAWLFMVGWNEADHTINQELFKRIRENSHVIFTGYTSEVEKYLAASDCYILPSYREGFGMGVIEAEAMGVPVIVSDIPGPTDAMINGKTGFVIPKEDSIALYDAMKSMMDNQEMTKAMGMNGIDYAIGSFEQRHLFSCILKDRCDLME